MFEYLCKKSGNIQMQVSGSVLRLQFPKVSQFSVTEYGERSLMT